MTSPMMHEASVTTADGGKRKVQAPVRQINVADISVDSEYQRDLDNAFVQKMLARHGGWREDKADLLLLSARGGRLWCLDGQHRLAMARECGVTKVWARVLEGLTKAEEAIRFAEAQEERRALRVAEKFKAHLAGNKEHALDIVKVLHAHQLRIDTKGHGSVGHISAIGALVKVYELGGKSLLDDTFTVLLREWTLDDTDAFQGRVIHGVAIYLFSFQTDPNFDIRRLDRVMPKIGPTLLLRKAQKLASLRQSATVSPALVAEALKQAYNEGLAAKNKLGDLRRSDGKKRA